MTWHSLSTMEHAGRDIAFERGRLVLQRVCPWDRPRVLEVGCGGGQLLRTLQAHVANLEAVGTDPYGLEGDRNGILFLRLGAEATHELLERFDLVVTCMSLHHFTDPGAFFRSALEAVRWPNGRLLVVDWKRGVDTGIPEDYYSRQEVVQAMKEAGWSPEVHEDHDWHFEVLARPTRELAAAAMGHEATTAKGMFGTAARFALYDLAGGDADPVEEVPNPYEKTRQHLKTLDVYAHVSRASVLVASRIGPRGVERLKARGIRMLLTGRPAPLADAIAALKAVRARCTTSQPPAESSPDARTGLPEGWRLL